MRKCLLVLLSLTSFMLWANNAPADTMIASFSGTVTSISGPSAAPSGIEVGTPFIGSYTYNSLANDSQISDTGYGVYGMGNPYTTQLTIGPYSYSWTSHSIHVFNNSNFILPNWPLPPIDQVVYITDWSPIYENWFALTFTDNSQAALSSDALPVFDSVLSNFPIQNIDIYGSAGGVSFLFDYRVTGALDSITLSEAPPIPEPTSLLLLGTGIGVIGLAAWRRRK